MILLIDNYDSFTYNLAHLFGELGAEVVVHRNDAITAEEAEAMAPMSAAAISSLRTTRTSWPSSPRYWTRL